MELEEKISSAEAVSFDLFDTLVMRHTLSPDDVAELVDCRLGEKSTFIENIRNIGFICVTILFRTTILFFVQYHELYTYEPDDRSGNNDIYRHKGNI